jgi:hypothetical protein
MTNTETVIYVFALFMIPILAFGVIVLGAYLWLRLVTYFNRLDNHEGM